MLVEASPHLPWLISPAHSGHLRRSALRKCDPASLTLNASLTYSQSVLWSDQVASDK